MEPTRSGGYILSKVHQLSQRIFARKMKDNSITDLNPAQGRILFTLWEEDDIPIQKLAKKTSLSKSTLTRMLERLERSGHILRVISAEDKRVVLVRLTEENKRMKATYEAVSKDMVELFYRGFKEDEILQFEDYLGRIFDNLEKEEDKL